MSTSLAKEIIDTARQNSGKASFIYFKDDAQKQLSYRGFLGLVSAFRSAIHSRAVAPRSLAILVAENSPKWPAAYLGAHINGLTVIHADVRYTADEFRNIERFIGPALVMCDKKFSGFFSDSPQKIFFEDIALEDENSFSLDVDDFTADPPVPMSVDQPMSIIFTSGTTGDPKGVMLSEANFMSNVSMFESMNDMVSNKDRIIAILPFHHVYPFTCSVLVSLRFGATLILPRSLKGEDIFGAVKACGATAILAVPRVLELFLERITHNIEALPLTKRAAFYLLLRVSRFLQHFGIDWARHIFRSIHNKFPTLRFFACGGAKLNEDIHRQLKELGFAILEAYGLTETSPIVAINKLNESMPGSAGKAAPGVELMIAKDEPTAREGEVLVRGPNVMMGYYKRPDATAKAIRDGWFHTGDLGYIDSNGRLYITGRKNEMIVLSTGKNIYPEELEKLYRQTQKVKEICIVLTKEGNKEALTAVVFPNKEYFKSAGRSDINQDIRYDIENLSIKLPPHQRVLNIVIFNEELPKTALGKLKRHEVIKRLKQMRLNHERAEQKGAAGHLQKPDQRRGGAGDPFLEFVARNLNISQGPDMGSNLETDLGLDSLAKLEFFTAVERAFGVKINEDAAATLITLKDLFSLVIDLSGRDEPDTTGLAQGNDLNARIQMVPDPPLVTQVSVGNRPVEVVARFIFHMVCKTLLKLLFNVRVEGKEVLKDLPPPFIIAPNHRSFIDGLIIYSFFPFRTINQCFVLGLPQFFEKFPFSLIQRVGRVVLTGTQNTSVLSLQYAHEILRSGNPMCVFPEGKRSLDIDVEQPKRGIGHVANITGAAFLPVYLSGTEKLFSRKAPGFHFAKLEMHILQPIYPNRSNGDVSAFMKKWQDVLQQQVDGMQVP